VAVELIRGLRLRGELAADLLVAARPDAGRSRPRSPEQTIRATARAAMRLLLRGDE
jgi:hypothetical protein